MCFYQEEQKPSRILLLFLIRRLRANFQNGITGHWLGKHLHLRPENRNRLEMIGISQWIVPAKVSFYLGFSFVCLFLKFSLFPSCKWVASGSKICSRRNYKHATEKRTQKDMKQAIFIRAEEVRGKRKYWLEQSGMKGGFQALVSGLIS